MVPYIMWWKYDVQLCQGGGEKAEVKRGLVDEKNCGTMAKNSMNCGRIYLMVGFPPMYPLMPCTH
jgi:hypothetical protein